MLSDFFSAIDCMSQTSFRISGKRVAFSGKLGGVSLTEAKRVIRNCGGHPVELDAENLDLIVLGADEVPVAQTDRWFTESIRREIRLGSIMVMTETQLWEHLGWVDPASENHRLFTPAMIADLLKIPIAEIRKWHRHGLIEARKEVHRLPYFEFEEVNTARRLAEMVAGGASPGRIKQNLEKLNELLPEIQRPLAQLSIIVEGQNIFMRDGDGIVEPNGQLRFDFQHLADNEPASESDKGSSVEPDDEEDRPWGDLHVSESNPQIFSIESGNRSRPDDDLSQWSFDDLFQLASEYEDDDRLADCIEVYRSILFAHGPNAEIHFRLAEVLYRMGQLEAARERYYSAIEIDDELVEARASLGCVLHELGQNELAIAAFQGALHLHHLFPDAHFHLARIYDQMKQVEKANDHWREFLHLAPESPWAAEARLRLNLETVCD